MRDDAKMVLQKELERTEHLLTERTRELQWFGDQMGKAEAERQLLLTHKISIEEALHGLGE